MSLFDASLPGLLYHRAGYDTRGIIMAELLADPGFDLLYGRLGSAFIPRDGGHAATNAIADMVDGANDRTAYVLFPEGRLFRSGPPRPVPSPGCRRPILNGGERLRSLQRVLPPRPGGFVTLLEALPDADVVVIDHRGLDRHRRLADFCTLAPVAEPVTVSARRYPRAQIPADRRGRIRWLDQRWLDLDQNLADPADRR